MFIRMRIFVHNDRKNTCKIVCLVENTKKVDFSNVGCWVKRKKKAFMKVRALSLLIAGAVIISTLTGCGKSSSDKAANEKKMTVTRRRSECQAARYI